MGFFNTKEKNSKKQWQPLLVGLFFGSLVTAFFSSQFYKDSSLGFVPIRQNNASTPLIRPLLAYNTPETHPMGTLKEDLTKIITKKRGDGVTTVAVYYRDLNTGKWFGINQDETFVPASLFKVPLMITYLKYAEKHPEILSTKIYDSLTRNENENETIKPLKTVTQGEFYTVEELLSYMIEYSDNNATVLLFKHIDQKTLTQVFADLDIQTPTTGVNSDFISVTNYSFLFRVLYNATYLSHDMSEKGLEMLSKMDFEDGIRKNIPSGVPVANKFGEYYLIGGTGPQEHQLHDCGIVYHAKHPYILCVMTKGTSLDALKVVLEDISRVTYSKVDALK